MSNFGKLLIQRKGYISQVYTILAIQLAFTFVIAKFLRDNQQIYNVAIKYFFPLVVLSFLIIFTFALTSKSFYLKLALFSCFAFISGILSIGATKFVSNEVIEVALLSTNGVFIGVSIISLGLTSIGIDLDFMYFILLSWLIGLIVVQFILFFVDVNHKVNKILAIISVILFSTYVAYDTNQMLQKKYDIHPLDRAMFFYLDIENIFTSFVSANLNQNGGK